MAKKTYALLDVVGVKAALKSGRGAELLGQFWRTADAWTNGVGNSWPPELVPGAGRTESPRAFVVTFSDSALLFTRPEFDLGVFYQIARSLKAALERVAGRVYCIVNRDDEIVHHDLPALGGITMSGSDLRPAYFNVAGSGAAWVNLHLADRAVGSKKEWHDRFSLYCVGRDSIPAGATSCGEQVFTSFAGGETRVFALE